jgi:hypothetical protein
LTGFQPGKNQLPLLREQFGIISKQLTPAVKTCTPSRALDGANARWRQRSSSGRDHQQATAVLVLELPKSSSVAVTAMQVDGRSSLQSLPRLVERAESALQVCAAPSLCNCAS